uniref:Integrase p58-like C-terminal domain-containing protein n=1 Tax=Strigamia maritima TaxID=126957 RepID=T1IYB3_STRMM
MDLTEAKYGDIVQQHEKQQFEELLMDNQDRFAKTDFDLGRVKVYKHTINTGDSEPIRDLVYLKKPNRKVGLSEKLLPQYSGPWEIIMKTAPNNYQITNHTRKKLDIVNVERLKKFNKRVDKIIEDIDPPQVDFSPEIEIINGNGERQMEKLQDNEENQEKEEITEKCIDDNDQIA